MCSGWGEIRRQAIPYSSTPHLLSSTAASRIPPNPRPPANRRCVFFSNGTAATCAVVVLCIRGTSSSAPIPGGGLATQQFRKRDRRGGNWTGNHDSKTPSVTTSDQQRRVLPTADVDRPLVLVIVLRTAMRLESQGQLIPAFSAGEL